MSDLQTKNSADSGFVLEIVRDFSAPRELLFEMWTDAVHLAQWFAPRDASIFISRIEAKPGGLFHFCHRHPKMGEVWVLMEFIEIVKPDRLVIRDNFSDAEGNRVVRSGFEQESIIEVFFEGTDKGTRIRIRQTGLEKDQGESEGWGQDCLQDRYEELYAGRRDFL